MAPATKGPESAGDKGKGKKEAPVAKDKTSKKKASASQSSSQVTASSGSAAASSSKESGDRFFLMKSEPSEFSIDQLEACTDATNCWEGVRNYQARNIMRDRMRVGDLAFFYHSSCKVPGIVGIIEIVRTAYPDHTQFDPKSKYYDQGSKKEDPRWIMVDVKLKRKLDGIITLEELKKHKEGGPLQNMVLLAKGRLSVQPVSPDEWKFIQSLIQQEGI